jgi:hypothetical protein
MSRHVKRGDPGVETPRVETPETPALGQDGVGTLAHATSV